MARATTGMAYLVFGLTLLGSLVFTVFVTVPAWSALGDARDQLKERTSERMRREEFLANIDTRTEELQAYERHARVLGVAFPDSKAPADLAAMLHAASTRNGVVISDVSEARARAPRATPVPTAAPESVPETRTEPASLGPAAPPAPAKSAHEVEYSLTARGTYAQLRAFVGDLERALRLFDLPAVTLTGGRTDEGGTVEAQVTLVTRVVVP